MIAEILFFGSIGFGVYTYAGYPMALRALNRSTRKGPLPQHEPEDWPMVSITVPAYNEEHQIAETIESLLALEYPQERKQILIVSDASTDRTDEIVRSYAERGVELVRQPERAGKTAAENAAAPLLRGEIVVNTDASIRIHPKALKSLIAPFTDPAVGLASGRDVSQPATEEETNRGEAGYVGYEMEIRSLETRAGGIVGASGCFYAIRKDLHRLPLPDSLSRDFAAALNTWEKGYRAVSVDEAACFVPRTGSLQKEYRRKVRTITRGIETLWHKRSLLNPFRHGRFAWMLFSHKVCRWLLPWVGLVALISLGLMSGRHAWARWLLGGAGVVLLAGVVGWILADRMRLPRLLSLPAYALMGNVAAMVAAVRALHGDRDPIWEPTRR